MSQTQRDCHAGKCGNLSLMHRSPCQLRLVTAGNKTKAKGETIPTVDLDHSQGEIHQFPLGKMGPHPLIHVVGDMILRLSRSASPPV